MTILARQTVDCYAVSRFIQGSGGTTLAGKGVGLPLITAGAASGSFYAIQNKTLAAEASKFSGITFNLTSGMAGTGLTGVWEYSTGTTANGAATWTALANVVDDTNGLTTSGTNTVTWEVPADWNNFGAVYSGDQNYYSYAVRYRITGGTLTGAGQLAAVPLCIMHGIKCASEGALTFAAIYAADLAGYTSHRARTGITATDASPVINRYFLSLGGRCNVGGASNSAYLVTTNFTGFTSATVRVSGLDTTGAAQTEDVTITGNGTSYLTKHWTALTSTQVTSVTGTGSFDVELRTARWGFVSLLGDGAGYVFHGDLTLTSSTTITSDTGETIVFRKNNRMTHISGSNVYGVQATPLHATKVPTFIFEQFNADLHHCTPIYGGTIYGCNVIFKRLTGANGSQGGWNPAYSQTMSLSNATLDGYRSVGHTYTRNYRNKALNCHWEAAGGVFAECHSLGSGHLANAGIRVSPNSLSYSGSPVGHALDVTGLASSITYDMSVYGPNSTFDNFRIQPVDFLWRKPPTDGNRISWFFLAGWSKSGNVVEELYSSEIYTLDTANNALSGVKMDVRRADGTTLVTALESNVNGFMTALGGTATAGTTTRVTDSSKNLVYNQYKRYELKITGGTGAGQRRYLGDTASNYFDCHPDFATAPSTDSVYALIPYFHCRTWSPVSTPATGTVASSVVNHGPFTVRMRKYGYHTITAILPFDQKTFLQYAFAVNPFNALSQSAAAALTGITVDHANQLITLSENHTLSEVYDYIAVNMLSNMGHDDVLTTTDGINYTCTYDLTLNTGVLLSGAGKKLDLGAKLLTMNGTADADFAIAYSAGTRVILCVCNLATGSRVRISKTSDNSTLAEGTESGGSFSVAYLHTVDIPCTVRVRKGSGSPKYLPYETQATITASGLTLTASQIPNTIAA